MDGIISVSSSRHMRLLSLLCCVVTLSVVTSCSDDAPGDSSSESKGLEASSASFGIVNILQATGHDVETIGDTSRPFFSPPAHVIAVNGSFVQLYEYESKEDLEKEASKISSDGATIGSKPIQWEVPPHFYKTDRVIVLYEGDDSTMKQTLTEAVGPQFAGK